MTRYLFLASALIAGWCLGEAITGTAEAVRMQERDVIRECVLYGEPTTVEDWRTLALDCTE